MRFGTRLLYYKSVRINWFEVPQIYISGHIWEDKVDPCCQAVIESIINRSASLSCDEARRQLRTQLLLKRRGYCSRGFLITTGWYFQIKRLTTLKAFLCGHFFALLRARVLLITAGHSGSPHIGGEKASRRLFEMWHMLFESHNLLQVGCSHLTDLQNHKIAGSQIWIRQTLWTRRGLFHMQNVGLKCNASGFEDVSLQFHTEQEYWCSYIMFCDKRSCSASLPMFCFCFFQ